MTVEIKLDDETRPILAACVDLIEQGHPEVFAKLVAQRLVRDDYIGWIPWNEERAVERQLQGLVEQGVLWCRKAPAGAFYDFPNLETLNAARAALGREPGAPTVGQAKEGPVSAPAQEYLRAALELYDAGVYEFTGEEFDERCPLNAASQHGAVLELIESGHLSLRSPKGGLVYWLEDVPAARGAIVKAAGPTPPRRRLSPLALHLGESV